MFEQINTQILNASKQFSDAAFKAQGIAMEGFEKAIGLQVKTAEEQWNATLAFLGEASQASNLDGVKTIMPKSVSLVREAAEKGYVVSQELVNVSVKTTEALGNIAKGQFEAANESFIKPTVNTARKTK